MKLNHVNLSVPNVHETRQFFGKYFGLRSMEGTSDDDTFIGLQDEDGFILTLMQTTKHPEVNYPSTFHIGFLNQGAEKANELYQQLKNDGYDVKPPGYYRGTDFYFYTPFGFTIQVS